MKRVFLALLLVTTAIQQVTVLADDKTTKEDKQKLYEKKDDKERIYKVDYETMWKACMKAAAEDNVIDHQDKEAGIISFKTGMSMSSWGFRVSVNLSKVDDYKTRVKIVTQKTNSQLVAWGAGGRTAEKYFKGVDAQLHELLKGKSSGV